MTNKNRNRKKEKEMRSDKMVKTFSEDFFEVTRNHYTEEKT
jgi:hypothetical protein